MAGFNPAGYIDQDPMRLYRSELAKALMSNSQPAYTPLAGLAGLGSKLVGAMMMRDLAGEAKGVADQDRALYAAALRSQDRTPTTLADGTKITWNEPQTSTMATILSAGSPQLQQVGMGIQLDEIKARRDAALRQAEEARKPPTTRERKVGDKLITEQWDSNLLDWIPLGEAPRFSPRENRTGPDTSITMPPNVSVGTIPQGYQLETVNGTLRMVPIPGGPADREIAAAAGKQDKANEQAARSGSIVIKDIARFKDAIKNQKWYNPVTGIGGMVAQFIPGSGRADAEALAKTVRSNIGFDRLQQMREASPTGGALGAVTERELGELQSVLGSLELSQSEEQLLFNLERLDTVYRDIMTKFAAYPDAQRMGIAPPPAPSGDALTAEERAELEALRKRFGR